MQAGSRPTDTRSLHSVHLKTLRAVGLNFGMLNGQPRHAIAATDAVRFLEIDDSVGILHDGCVRRTRRQAARIFAVHALVFAHQQHHAAVFALVFVELDQVPVIPCRFRHRLVGVVERGFAERVTVPFQARHFARFAADARGRIHQLADLELAVQPGARDGAGVP